VHLLAERFCTKSVLDGCWHSEVVLQQRLHEALQEQVEAWRGGKSGCVGFCLMKRDAVTIWQQLADVFGGTLPPF